MEDPKEELETRIKETRELRTQLPIEQQRLHSIEDRLHAEKAILADLEKQRETADDKKAIDAKIAIINARIQSTEEEIRVKSERVLEVIDDYRKGLIDVKELMDEINKLTEETGTLAEKAYIGAERAILAFADSAANLANNVENLITTTLEGFSTAISDVATALFRAPKEEIEGVKQELRSLEEEKQKITKKMQLIEVGGVLPEQIEEYRDLEEQWKQINEQIREANDNLNELESTEKRVGEAFRKFGETILDTLQEMIAKMLVFNMLQGIIGGIFPGEGIADSILKFFEKGGVVKGGFTPIDKSQLQFFKKLNIPFFQHGTIANSPTLGVIGEGSRSEAVVPLPDNKHIPVKFTGEGGKTGQDVKIVNLLDPKMIPSIMLQHPDAIINVINEDIVRRGPIYQLIKSVR